MTASTGEMMRNLDTALDAAGVARLVTSQPVSVIETVTVTPRLESRAFVTRPGERWTWSDLRDYVVSEIETRFGPQVRDAKREYGIFTRFLKTWGTDAHRIARYAFEVERGMWNGQPVGVSRFTKGSDPYFAAVIAERLASAHKDH